MFLSPCGPPVNSRLFIRMLKMNPAAAAPSEPLTSRGPALSRVCSLTMISSTAAAKPLPWARLNSDWIAVLGRAVARR